jgi:hypothetical protein
VVLSVLAGADVGDTVGEVAGKEAAGRSVASLKWRLRRPARSGESSQSTADAAVRATSSGEPRVLQDRRSPKPVARPSPWYFTTGERNKVQQPDAHLGTTQAGEMAPSRSRNQWQQTKGCHGLHGAEALLALGQSDRTQRPTSKPSLRVQPIVDDAPITVSKKTKTRSLFSLPNVPRFSCADHAEVSARRPGQRDRGPCERSEHLGREQERLGGRQLQALVGRPFAIAAIRSSRPSSYLEAKVPHSLSTRGQELADRATLARH